MKETLPHLSPTELDLMKILWAGTDFSARAVQDGLPDHLDWSYSTTRTVIDRLVVKGYVAREGSHRQWTYRALISRPEGLAAVIRDFAIRVVGASTASVVSLFTDSGSLSAAEAAELATILERLER